MSKISNTQYIILNLLETPILAFILAYVIRYIADPNSDVYIFSENENIPIFIFMALIVALFIGLTVSAEEIFKDRKILKREAFLNLSRSSYLFSKIAILVLLSAIQTATFVLIANSILGIRGMYFDYWLVLFSTAVCANLLGLNISATFNSAITIYIVIPLLMIPMMVLSGAMFSFEKLNRAVGSFNRVPLIAEFMPTKWGYEALVVHQYKDNEFQKIFYDIDKVINSANYKISYYIDELEKRVTDLVDLLPQKDNPEVREQITEKVAVLRNSIYKETSFESPSVTFDYLNKLTPDSIDETTIYALFDYLELLKRHYSDIYNTQSQKRDRMIAYLVKNNRELYEAKKRAYQNESLTDLVRKTFEKNKVVQYGNELVQQNDPIYRDPIPRSLFDFRSHFLAPRKHFLGMYFDTFWFNLAIIWLMTIILYITLYYETLKKLIDYFGKIKIPALKN